MFIFQNIKPCAIKIVFCLYFLFNFIIFQLCSRVVISKETPETKLHHSLYSGFKWNKIKLSPHFIIMLEMLQDAIHFELKIILVPLKAQSLRSCKKINIFQICSFSSRWPKGAYKKKKVDVCSPILINQNHYRFVDYLKSKLLKWLGARLHK